MNMEVEDMAILIRDGEGADDYKAASAWRRRSKAAEEYKMLADLTDFPNLRAMIEAEAQASARKRKKKRRGRRKKNQSCTHMEFHAQQQLSVGAVTDRVQAPPGEAGRSFEVSKVASVGVSETENGTSQKHVVGAACKIVETVVAGENRTGVGLDSAEIIHLCVSSSVEDGLTSNTWSRAYDGEMVSTDSMKNKRRETAINNLEIIRAEGSLSCLTHHFLGFCIKSASGLELCCQGLMPYEADALVKEMQEEKVKVSDTAIISEKIPVENIVLWRLLRRPRYFNPLDTWVSCPNCGEDHNVGTCEGKKQKPCSLCGSYQHSWQLCGQDCFCWKRRCNVADDCQVNEGNNLDTICLRCGATGHDMFSCRNNYCPEDLKEIQCYICSSFGHLCCSSFPDTAPREISCYNCGLSGHLGFECIKPRKATRGSKALAKCYRCREKGHFARTCSISRKQARRLQTDLRINIGANSAPAKSFEPENEKPNIMTRRES